MNEEETKPRFERRTPPDRRKEDFEQLNKRIDERFEKLTERLARFITKALIAFAIIGITSAVAIGGFGLVLGKIKDTRKDFVFDTCTAQNKRNSNTVKAFNEEAKRIKKIYPAQAGQIDQSVKSNLRLINTLAPKQDCKRLSDVSVGDAEPPPPATKTSVPKESP